MIWYLNWLKWAVFLFLIASSLTAFAKNHVSIISNQAAIGQRLDAIIQAQDEQSTNFIQLCEALETEDN